MRMVDLIAKTRDHQALTTAELQWLIQNYVADKIPDYQMSAWLMAVYFNGLSDAEQGALAQAMLDSGERLDLTAIPGVKVDKHSTGGVGDKLSIPLVPLVACFGVPVPMVSGRGLGFTGGTLDKLESIPGFNVHLTSAQFIQQVTMIHQAITSASQQLAPADQRLYALRDVTGTVASKPLIASSIMSKKLASGTDALLFDVKSGNGAFMPDDQAAENLAQALLAIAQHAGVKAVAMITDMNQPLGITIGNSLEVAESIALLKGRGPQDVHQLLVAQAAQMLKLGGKTPSLEVAMGMVEDALKDGRAAKAFKQLIQAQGGDPRVVDDPRRLPQATHKVAVKAAASGVVTAMDTKALGTAVMQIGGGRATQSDALDLTAGIVLHKKLGTPVTPGETLAVVYASSVDPARVATQVRDAYTIAAGPIEKPSLIHRILS
ncbi:thymidine phosphorylase [Lacticaseibacillus baoqingensis]|uniref:Pyrimidine-nucleoside phosphorylase n=1 Tax=Lacticaseibacillus baoqingensis TaxID=2486013 RepID=A0ABW4E833_9LACO|nr:thymidine phosphorylase [Lacticaseibacillus baoqingensis]